MYISLLSRSEKKVSINIITLVLEDKRNQQGQRFQEKFFISYDSLYALNQFLRSKRLWYFLNLKKSLESALDIPLSLLFWKRKCFCVCVCVAKSLSFSIPLVDSRKKRCAKKNGGGIFLVQEDSKNIRWANGLQIWGWHLSIFRKDWISEILISRDL